jgi:hypothetical protein
LKTPPPAFAKANKKKQAEGEKKPRKKRDAQYNKARPRSEATEIAEHRVINCPQCHQHLGGITLARKREVIDIPPPSQVIITEHRIASSAGVPIVRSGMKRQWICMKKSWDRDALECASPVWLPHCER